MLNLMIIHLVGLLSPGPDFFYVSRISAMSSRREAIGGVIGITIGVLIWATAAVLGLAIIFATDANCSRYCDDAWRIVFSLSRH